MSRHVRHGMGAVRPFIYGGLDLLDFACEVLGAVELERNKVAGGFHVQAQIGDSVIVLSAMDPPYAQATASSTYVYVTNVDETYARAMACGAESLSQPTERPFQERTASVKDGFGNIWFFATYKGAIKER